MLLLFFESQIKLLENSHIDDSIVFIVRKKVDNKLTNSSYVSLLWDVTTDILVAKKFSVFFYGPHNNIQNGPHFLLPMSPWHLQVPSNQLASKSSVERLEESVGDNFMILQIMLIVEGAHSC